MRNEDETARRRASEKKATKTIYSAKGIRRDATLAPRRELLIYLCVEFPPLVLIFFGRACGISASLALLEILTGYLIRRLLAGRDWLSDGFVLLIVRAN